MLWCAASQALSLLSCHFLPWPLFFSVPFLPPHPISNECASFAKCYRLSVCTVTPALLYSPLSHSPSIHDSFLSFPLFSFLQCQMPPNWIQLNLVQLNSVDRSTRIVWVTICLIFNVTSVLRIFVTLIKSNWMLWMDRLVVSSSNTTTLFSTFSYYLIPSASSTAVCTCATHRTWSGCMR